MKGVVLSTLIVAVAVFADDNRDDKDDRERYREEMYQIEVQNSKGFNLYKSECSSCHLAYQAEFLPKRSWKKIMGGLENHFGVDASIDKDERVKITEYLTSNSSDSKRIYGEFKEFYESIPEGKTFLKISEIPYFRREHKKIPKRFITQKEVKSISNCTACHQNAQRGDFDEGSLRIPNYGKWED
jgi:nitrate/TMAO reductase-like tetraheme cytochrome c subunit